jgi:hypothetical protein
MRARVTCLAASCALAVAAPAFARTADVEDLGRGIYRAAGVMGGTAPVPQSNSFMIVTRGDSGRRGEAEVVHAFRLA